MYLLPSLMVEVCLVLAPDVNFFLNTCNQGLPCWHSLFFFTSHILNHLKELSLQVKSTQRIHKKSFDLKTMQLLLD